MEDGNETILLSEQITVHGNPLKHFSQTNGVLNKTEPLVFANRNNDEKEIEISMQYEGLPVEPLNIFLEVIGEKWNEKTTKLPLRS